MAKALHLEGLRCDGDAHGGCQAGCLIFWKEAWLKRESESSGGRGAAIGATEHARAGRCTEEAVLMAVTAPGERNPADLRYSCQSTRLSQATQPLPWWDVRQYVEDFTSGNVRLSQMLAAFLFFCCHTLATSGLGVGTAMRWSYDLFQEARGGTPYPWRRGLIPEGMPTPVEKLNLQEGELARVKGYREILRTLDSVSWRNRGLYFDAELVPFCNRTFRVLRRVQQIIEEKTGRLIKFKSDALILNDVFCQARYSKCRRFCPRSIYPYWREIWLERIGE